MLLVFPLLLLLLLLTLFSPGPAVLILLRFSFATFPLLLDVGPVDEVRSWLNFVDDVVDVFDDVSLLGVEHIFTFTGQFQQLSVGPLEAIAIYDCNCYCLNV